MADQLKLTKVAEDLVELAKVVPSPSGRGKAIDDGEIRAALGRAVIGSRTLQSMTYQLVSRQIAGAAGPADSSLLRIQFSLVAQYIHQLAMRLRGADGLVDDSALGERSWTYNYLWSFQTSIGGGTREIQRNIVGDRHLLLPR
jgi:alkylation response protein AidB-like acyl-CoA dehydrogenase